MHIMNHNDMIDALIMTEALRQIADRDPCNHVNGVTGECVFSPPCFGCVARKALEEVNV